MITLDFEDIYSSFLQKIDAYDFLELSDEEATEFMAGWIKSVGAKPHVRSLFSTYSCNVDSEMIDFEMNYVIDEDTDIDFVIEVFALGAIVEWLTPKVNSLTHIYQTYGSKEEKFYSESSHLKEIRALRDSFKNEQRKMIRDRGYYYNDYIEGYR